jgi:mannobiose 2-epimerase
MKVDLWVYKQEAEKELDDILSYWIKHAVDREHGGFYGKIDNENHTYPDSPKGSVLNSRILWAFSAAYNLTKKQEYLLAAKRACDYIFNHFIDYQFGCVYWSVDYTGSMLNGRKQMYGLAFCIYGLSEYYKASRDRKTLQAAIELFKKIEQYSFDKQQKGYYEAFNRDWELVADLRLSSKDANEKKTTNTHLHIVEAYSNLFEVWEDEWLKTQIENLLEVFLKYIIDPETGHLNLFFDEQWNKKLNIISYGHDIEAAWLLLQCAEKIKSHKFIEETHKCPWGGIRLGWGAMV